MKKGRSLHIGLNLVDPAHYQGWSGRLIACEADANDMRSIAINQGFTPTTLLTASATCQNVIKELELAASKLDAGDIFFLSYSGHGGQLPDWNNDEEDQEDETWCLYDGQLVDDQIYEILGTFKRGVRILVFSDSCHSGTVLKMAYTYSSSKRATELDSPPNLMGYRAMPSDVARRVYQANKAVYDPVLNNPKLKNSRGRVQASVLLISGCQDNQYSADGTFNGLFTGTLLRVWRGGTFRGNYPDFHQKIVRKMPPDQTPNYFKVGMPDPAFENQKPFTI